MEKPDTTRPALPVGGRDRATDREGRLPGGAGSETRSVSLPWLATFGGLLVALGVGSYSLRTVSVAPGEKAEMDVVVITDVEAIKNEILGMKLEPHDTQDYFRRADENKIVMLRFTISAVRDPRQNGERQSVTTSRASWTREYVLGTRQTFVLPIDRSAAGFTFTAISTPTGGRMTGNWVVETRSTPYDLKPMESKAVPLR